MTYREIQEQKHAAVLLNQQNGRAELYDLDAQKICPQSLLRSWDTGYATGLKLRHSEVFGGDTLFVATDGIAVFSLDGDKLLWQAPCYADNAHSIEWIERHGVICLACSTGAVILFYHTTDASKPFATLPLLDAHGVLWDEARGCLWAVGHDILAEIHFRGGLPITAHEYRMPQGLGGAHDLSAVYGAPDRLWITCNYGRTVVQFDKKSATFVRDYDGAQHIPDGFFHKGIGNFTDGCIAWMYPDGKVRDSLYHKNASWLTDRISFYDGTQTRTLASDTGLFYKLRVCNTDYQ